MYNSPDYYRGLTHAQIEKFYIALTVHRDLYHAIHDDDIDEAINFIKQEIRRRKLIRLDRVSKFKTIIDEAEKVGPPDDLMGLFYTCKTSNEAKQVLDFIIRCHKVDSLWEENWLEEFQFRKVFNNY